MNKTVHAIISVAESDQVGIITKMTKTFSEYKITLMHELVFNAMHHIN